MHHTPFLVSDVMSRPVVAVRKDASFKEIVEAMDRWKVSALPVLERGERVVGVVCEGDLLPKAEFPDSGLPGPPDRTRREPDSLDGLATLGAVTAEQLMSSPAVTIRPEATLAQAARAMARRHVKRLPVADSEGRLRGVVSRSDLLKVFLRSDAELAEEVRREVVARLFPACCGDVHIRVEQGVVTLSGRVDDSLMMPVAARLVRAVEGVVDVAWALDDVAPASAEPAGRRPRPGM
ncbi:CBS domain-containing protein [Streptomyces sp. NPDC052236]|uniref:CBS domain-containing protein n=1 Tax=Streptomyces sp. NPDC052236 TaxID=3365686 RepID=UPI0037D5A5B4